MGLHVCLGDFALFSPLFEPSIKPEPSVFFNLLFDVFEYIVQRCPEWRACRKDVLGHDLKTKLPRSEISERNAGRHFDFHSELQRLPHMFRSSSVATTLHAEPTVAEGLGAARREGCGHFVDGGDIDGKKKATERHPSETLREEGRWVCGGSSRGSSTV